MSHKNQNTVPYCYLIGWPSINRYYFGVKFGIGSDPNNFWKTYFTSSVLVKQYRKMYGEPTLIEIRKEFHPDHYGSVSNAQEKAVEYENKVLRRMNMITDHRFLNCSNNVKHRVGSRITNHTKFRFEKYNGSYHSHDGIEAMRKFNKNILKNTIVCLNQR